MRAPELVIAPLWAFLSPGSEEHCPFTDPLLVYRETNMLTEVQFWKDECAIQISEAGAKNNTLSFSPAENRFLESECNGQDGT